MNAPGGHMTVRAGLRHVAQAVPLLRQALPRRLPEAQCDAVEIALAELLNNIVLHGFAGGAEAPIEVSWRIDGDTFVVDVRDGGRPIPPAKLEAAGPGSFAFDAADLDALPEGGFGLALVKAAFDHVDYRSDAGGNCMHLEKSLA